MPPTYACDRFGLSTSAEDLHVEGRKSVMVEINGDDDSLIHVALHAYAFRDFPFLTVASLARKILPYCFERMVLN